jgi:hypothetical protein
MSSFDHPSADAPWESLPGATPTDWELSAAAVDLAVLARADGGPMALPAELAARISRGASPHLRRAGVVEARRDTPAGSRRPAHRSELRSWLSGAGWWTAACLAGLLVWQWFGPPRLGPATGGPAATPSLVELRAQLLAADPEVVTIAWKQAGDDPAVVASPAELEKAGGLGDVVWSPVRQQGFMRFRGLAANDPAQAQYQLWIFDAERNEAYPVDGGVFDVPAEADGDVVVRIDPRLPVSRATAFAITVEQPGGVVVSSRERLPLLAALP